MDAALGVLGGVGSTIGPIFALIGLVFSKVRDVLVNHSVLIFFCGFFGILLTFLWFFFRYLDQKKLSLPTFVFTFFFLMFLSGNLLMIAQDAERREAALNEALAQATEEVETEGTAV